MIFRFSFIIAALAVAAVAHDEHKAATVTLVGTVVDTGCYMSHATLGEKHTDCAAMCARNGVPLAIVDRAGKLYLPIADDHKNPNTRLLPFIEKKVKVTGVISQKGGLSGIAIKTVEAAP